MKTVIHAYRFDTKTVDGAAAWKALRAQLKATGIHRMKSWGGQGHYDFVRDIDGQTVDLETAYLFNNQWNTAPIDGVSDKGLRVFDWAQDYMRDHQAHIKQGHWLEQTAEMREIRRNTHHCRYCGKMEPAQKGYVFCPHCLDSEYLKESDLFLTRMMAIDDRSDPAPLTEAERGYLLPLFRDAQLHGTSERGKARIAKKRRDIVAKRDKAINSANTEYHGFLWLMDHGLSVDNVIYYDHTGKFSFGWRKPLTDDEHRALESLLVGFAWPYEIKSVARAA